MLKIYCIKNTKNQTVDITNIVKDGMKLKKSVDEFAWVLDFNITRNEIFIDVEVGDIMVIKLDNEDIFSGVIITGDITNLKYKAVDYAWYFAKNEEIYQFEDVEASVVVTKLIETFGGNIGEIETTNMMVDNFYFGKTLGSIIKEIIKNTKELENKDYRFFYKNTKFHFVKSKKDKFLEGNYGAVSILKAVLNDYQYNALNYIEEPQRKVSIEEMHNSIKVYKTTGKEYIQTSQARDEEKINKYGLMQKLVEFKDNDLNGGNIKANNILFKESKVKESLNINIPVLNQFIYDGEILELMYLDYGILGFYEVKSISYTFEEDKSIFSASIKLEKVESNG